MNETNKGTLWMHIPIAPDSYATIWIYGAAVLSNRQIKFLLKYIDLMIEVEAAVEADKKALAAPACLGAPRCLFASLRAHSIDCPLYPLGAPAAASGEEGKREAYPDPRCTCHASKSGKHAQSCELWNTTGAA